MEKLIDSFNEMSTFCGLDEYRELVRNNDILNQILQTNILNYDFFEYLCSKFNYYNEKINFEESKNMYPEYSNEIDAIKLILVEFLSTSDIKQKIILAKDFHFKLINTLNAIDCFYSVFDN